MARLLSSILFYSIGFWDPSILPLSPKGIYFLPQGLLNNLYGVLGSPRNKSGAHLGASNNQGPHFGIAYKALQSGS